jgi:hypothetical protein
MSDPESAREVDTLLALVRERYGARLGADQLEDIHKSIEAIVGAARALRAVRLTNADEPGQPFAAYRADS